jgi:hypothetical protein
VSDTTIHEPAHHAGGDHLAGPHLGWALAGLSAGAAVIHFAMTPIHASVGWEEPLMLAGAGWFQLVTAAMALTGRGGRRLLQVVVAANLVFIGVWLWSRTAGLPFGENPGIAEEVGAIDAAAVALQVGTILVAVRMLLAPAERSVGRLAPALAAVAALGLATTVITSPDAAEHGHVETLTALEALEAEVAETRCDTEFNHRSYWAEAERVGVDTTWGGMPPEVAGSSGDGHGHGGAAAATGTTVPDPTGGRGSPGLDGLVSATALAATSEIEAARLIRALSDASDEDYDAWLWWLRSSESLAHEHSASVSEEDGSGHGGHVGPQPWRALTDPAQCAQLAEELQLARETALSYPTAQDALDAGYVMSTPYVAGIAAHYIKRELIDSTFAIDEPEMLLYDGNGRDARIVGLSYYLWHPGDYKPTQGFTGDNDAAHRHQGLCSDPDTGLIIGDTTTTAEACAARGGTKSDGSKGWMSHAWVVPGCESPWGVFSAASPILDHQLPKGSGTDGGGCASSGVRDRYQLGTALVTPRRQQERTQRPTARRRTRPAAEPLDPAAPGPRSPWVSQRAPKVSSVTAW